MKQTYLSKYTKKNSQILPYITKKLHQINQANNSASTGTGPNTATKIALKMPTQQSLLLQIKDIDQSLHNKNITLRHGLIFSSEINDRLVGELYACLKKNVLVMEDGFSLWNHQGTGSGNGGSEPELKRLSNKVETLNQRIVKKSFQNVYNYDLQKYMHIMKMNRNKWSMFKRSQQQANQKYQATHNYSKPIPKLVDQSMLKLHQSITQSHQSQKTSMSASTIIKNSNLQTSKLNPGTPSKLSRISGPSPPSLSPNRKVLTEIPQSNPQQIYISKYDIKNMLKKQKQHSTQPQSQPQFSPSTPSSYPSSSTPHSTLVFLHLPPVACPQFYGMFTYSLPHLKFHPNPKNPQVNLSKPPKKQQICKLKKYYFFRRALNERFFNAILQEISARQDRYVEGMEIVVAREDYVRVYEGIGWKMRAVQGDRVRIRYLRD